MILIITFFVEEVSKQILNFLRRSLVLKRKKRMKKTGVAERKGAKWKTSRMAQDVRFQCRRSSSREEKERDFCKGMLGSFKCRKTSLRRNEPIRTVDYLLLKQLTT